MRSSEYTALVACANNKSTSSHQGKPNVNSIVDGNTRDSIKKQDKSPQHQKEEILVASTPFSVPSISLCFSERSTERLLLPSANATVISSSGKFVYNL
jgi:hypothetical protein